MRLTEVVIALLLGLLLLTGVWRASALVRGQVAVLDRTAAEIDARRVVGMLLDLEAVERVTPPSGGELSVRAFRWWGPSCDPSAASTPGRVVVAWRGLRLPDPDKDSVELLSSDGKRRFARLVYTASSTRCGGSGVEVAWEGPPEPEPVLVRGFERGGYRLDDAFRYRRGAGGAQPLTAAVFDPDSVLLNEEWGVLRLRIAPWPTRAWSGR